jgi:hypothetical protein
VGGGPGGAGEMLIGKRRKEMPANLLFKLVREELTRQRLRGHQSVEVGVCECEAPVGVGESTQVSAGAGGVKRVAKFARAIGDDRRLELGLAGHVLVERRRLDPELRRDASRGRRDHPPRGGGDRLPRSRLDPPQTRCHPSRARSP